MDEESYDIIHAVYDEPLAAHIDAWLDPEIERDAMAVEAFLLAARGLAAHCASFGTGVPLPGGRCVSFTFAPAHVPDGLEFVRDWLRAQPRVRLVEVERYYPPVT